MANLGKLNVKRDDNVPKVLESHHCIYDDPEVAHPRWKKNSSLDPQLCNPLSIESQFEGPMKNLYFPFGSAGGGAPNVDKEGNIQPLILSEQTLRRDLELEAQKKKIADNYARELEKEILNHKLNKLKEDLQAKAPANNLADIILNGATGRPKRNKETGEIINQGLHTTDVTNWNYNVWSSLKSDSSNSINNIDETRKDKLKAEAEELEEKMKRFRKEDYITNLISDRVHLCHDQRVHLYANDLLLAATDRSRLRQLERLKEKQEAQAHIETFSNFWGKPGGGAPNSWGLKKVKLDSIHGYEDQLGNIGTDFKMRHRKMGQDINDQSGYIVQDIAPTGSYYDRTAYVHPSGNGPSPRVNYKLPIHSDHANFYELSREDQIEGSFRLHAPYAHNNEY